ncbi:MAG: carbohydrate ABC transporter permease [Spirochaetales bacterium]|nr:carbohydrate ABC transporter permease [Spirochaetales bacterium]
MSTRAAGLRADRVARQSGGLSLWQRKSVRAAAGTAAAYLVAVVGAVALFLPILWALLTGLKEMSDVLAFPPRFFPRRIVWSNFVDAIVQTRLAVPLLNSLVICAVCAVGQVLSGSLTAYGFARLRFPGRDAIFICVLATMMVPFSVIMIPRFMLFRRFGWVDTWLPLIVPWFFGGHPFYIFLLRQYFMSVPREMDDAARIDGCSLFGIYWRVMMPLTVPALATVAIFTFRQVWLDLLAPLIFINREELFTVSLRLAVIAPSSVHGQVSNIPYNVICLAALLTVVPLVLIFAFFQRYFVQGIVITGVKG